MQFNQPGYFNFGHPLPSNYPFQFNGYPEVVGEGNVTSVMSSDGSMQLLFLPTTQWWRPYPFNNNVGNVNNNWIPTGAWFIRSVYNPLQPMPCQVQPIQTPSGIACHRTYSSDCCVSQPACPSPNFELKFHNDICTSTSDIHYFYPSLRPYDWFRKPIECVSVQVDSPMTSYSMGHHTFTCTKPCNCCVPMDETENTAKCSGHKYQKSISNTSMSCDTDTSRTNCACFKNKDKIARTEKNKLKRKGKTKSKVKCECKEQKTSEKCVSTVVDQACGGVEDRGRETQTACGIVHDTQTACEIVPLRNVTSGSTSKTEMQAELWKPKTPTSKKTMSGNFSGICESDCCSGTCSCHSETD